MSNGTIPFDTSGIDPNIILLGKLAGLITNSNEVNTDWFKDPRGSIEAIPTARGPELVALLQSLLGNISGSALNADNGLGNSSTPHRSWYPLHGPSAVSNGSDAVPAGLYLVVDTNDAESTYIFGLGLLHTFHPDVFTLTTYGYFPLLELPAPDNSTGFLLGASAEYPLEIGFELRGSNGAFGDQDISFDGLKVATSFSFGGGGTPSIDYEIVLLNLQLPGESTASNRSLQQLEAINANEWITTAISLFVAQIINRIPPAQADLAEEAGNLAHNLLNLLGLAGDIQSFDWQQLISATNVEAVLNEWLGSIAGSPATLTNWLNVWHCLRNGLKPAADGSDIRDHVKGSGTRADPWSITLFDTATTPPFGLKFTIATVVDAGNLHVYPGLRMAFTQLVPNIPQLEVRGEALVELVEIVYPAAGSTNIAALEQRIFPSFELLASAVNAVDDTKPLFSVSDSSITTGTGSTFSIDTIQAGLSYSDVGGSAEHSITPTFRLTGVKTKSGAWPEIDLTNFDQDIKLLESAIGPLVQSAIKDFLGVGRSETNELAAGLAAILGVIPPQSAAGSTWNVPLLIDDLGVLVANPLGALSSYFTRCLNTLDSNEQPLFQHLLPEFARVLGASTGPSQKQSGSGTPDDPWQVALANIPGNNSDSNLSAFLQLWRPQPKNNELRLAVKLISPLPVPDLSASFEAVVELLHLMLPAADGSGPFNADWLPGVSARLRVRGMAADQYKLQSAPVAGVSIGLDDLLLSAGWDKQKQFYWAANIDNISVGAPNQTATVVGNLNFGSGTTAWEQQDLDTFAQLVIDAAGMWLFERGGRLGVLLTTAFGLLPSLPNAVKSQGVTLPDDWPVLNLAAQLKSPSTFFTSPGSALRPYLAQLFSKAEHAEPLMQMIGSAINGVVQPQPATTRSGTIDDPWSVKLTNAWDLELLFWTESDPGNTSPDYLGMGLRKTVNQQSAQDVALDATLTVYAVRISLGSGAAKMAPSCSLSCGIKNSDPSKPLLVESASGLTIESAHLGVTVDASGVNPVVRFTATGGGAVIELIRSAESKAFIANESMQVMEALLHSLLAKLTSANQSFPLLQSMLNVLTDLEVVQVTAQGAVQSYGINIGAWNAFLADPMTFLTSQMAGVLQDQDSSQNFSQHLTALTGFSFTLPGHLQGLPEFLAAIGLMKSTADGHIISPSAWLNLIQDPIGYLEINGKRLLNDPTVRQQLITALKSVPATIVPPGSSRFNFSVASGTQVTLEIPPDSPLCIGPEVQVFGRLVMDLKSLTLSADLSLSSEAVGSALALSYTLDAASSAGGEWSLSLEGAPGKLPQPFERLVIYPIPDLAAYFDRIGSEIPLFVLSAVATKVLNEYVLPQSPLAARIFNAFALTDVKADQAKIESLLGIFLHPVDWALNAEVFGDGSGKISPPKIVDKVKTILGTTGFSIPAGISLVPGPGTNGMILNGLPYGVTLSLTADATTGVAVAVEIAPTFPAPAPSIAPPSLQVSAGLSFGVNAMAVHGDASLTFNLGQDATTTQLIIDSSYLNGSFQLAITAGEIKSTLVPFGGFNQFAAGATSALMSYVAKELSQIYEQYRAQASHNPEVITFVDSVTTFAGFLNVHTLDDLVKPETGALAQIKTNPTQWLSQWFSAGQAATTLKEIETLLTATFFPGFAANLKVTGSLLQFTPTIDSALGSLILNLGLKTDSNGQEAFGIWFEPQIRKELLVLNAEVGVALEMPWTNGHLAFDLNASLQADIENFPGVKGFNVPQMSSGPELKVNFDYRTSDSNFQPTIELYPLGNGANGGATDALVIALLPKPLLAYANAPGTGVGALPWLETFSLKFLVPLIADTTIGTAAVSKWLDTIVAANTTPGTLLAEWGLLNKGSSGQYELADFVSTFSHLPATSRVEQIIAKLVSGALSALKGQTIITFGADGQKGNGRIFVAASGAGDYGFGLQLIDLPMGAAGSNPQILLQLGKWHTDEKTSADSWIARSDSAWVPEDPGIVFYLMRDAGGSFSFRPKLDLISVGIDAVGSNKTRLVDVKGFRFEKVETRAFLSADIESFGNSAYGASIMFGGLSLPLGPGSGGSSGSSNPVAQSLVSSNSNGSNNAGAVNPSFSAKASDVKGGTFELQIFRDDGTTTDGMLWFPVQRAFGPVHCQRIGIEWQSQNDVLSLGFDGSVLLGGLSVDLVDLSIGVPVETPTDFDAYQLGLKGLDIAFSGGPVAVSGGLVKTDDTPPMYNGSASISAASYTIGGFGSYGTLDGHASVFTFFVLNAPLGGPPFFYVTGVAAGFGYNRAVTMPAPDQVQNFPLVAFAVGTVPGASPAEQLESALPALTANAPGTNQPYIYPSLGEYWVAIGVHFTSFKLIDSFALLLVEFGKELEIAVLGLSKIQLPPEGSPIAYAELAISVVIIPDEGALMVNARLTPNSWVLDPACRLTGGFAFYSWFSGGHKGDFVVTLGGYHPSYTPPLHYPTVPRLAFNWPCGDLTLSGDVYFALTPTCVMAGGALSAVYQTGSLRAWFDAQADFLISWKPFHYDIEVSISVGISYTVHMVFFSVTFKVEMGVALHLYGPEFGGRAHIDWYVISFDIPFGADPAGPPAVKDWPDFATTFLPEQDSIIGVQITSGLIDTYKDPETTEDIWIVKANSLVLTTQTVIPATQIQFPHTTAEPINSFEPDGTTPRVIGVQPMGLTDITSVHTFELKTKTENTAATQAATQAASPDLSTWNRTGVSNGSPSALWATTPRSGVPASGDEVVPGTLIGGQLSPGPRTDSYQGPSQVWLKDLGYTQLSSAPLPLVDTPQGVAPVAQPPDVFAQISLTVMQRPDVVTARSSILKAMAKSGAPVTTEVDLSMMAAQAKLIFVATPTFGALGTIPQSIYADSAGTTLPGTSVAKEVSAVSLVAVPAPRLRAVIRQYVHPATEPGRFTGEIGGLSGQVKVTGVVHHGTIQASRRDLRGLRSFVSRANDEAGERHQMNLHTGATLLWDLPVQGASPRTLNFDGVLPLRIATFDKHQRLLEDVTVGENGAGSYSLPAGAAQASLTGLSPNFASRNSSSPRTVGWHNDLTMIQVNHVALLGNGVIVRPHIPRHIGSGSTSRNYGLLSAQSMLETNEVSDGAGGLCQSWIETFLPTDVRTIGVMMRNDEDETISAPDSVTVSLISSRVDQGRESYQNVTLEALPSNPNAPAGYLFYALPELEPESGQPDKSYLRIRTQPRQGWITSGVIGLSLNAAETDAEAWQAVPALYHEATSEALGRDRRTTTNVELV